MYAADVRRVRANVRTRWPALHRQARRRDHDRREPHRSGRLQEHRQGGCGRSLAIALMHHRLYNVQRNKSSFNGSYALSSYGYRASRTRWTARSTSRTTWSWTWCVSRRSTPSTCLRRASSSSRRSPLCPNSSRVRAFFTQQIHPVILIFCFYSVFCHISNFICLIISTNEFLFLSSTLELFAWFTIFVLCSLHVMFKTLL